MKKQLLLITTIVGALTIVCSGGLMDAPPGNGFAVNAPGGSLFQSTTDNVNCGAGAEDCIGEQEYGDTGGNGGLIGSKTGESCASVILGLIATGDLSLKSAADVGGITKVHSVDRSYSRVVSSVYQQTCILVNGE
ncbi:MAG: TRL-like family protein [bacterium]|nr:TRL-like family protein [bacterium]